MSIISLSATIKYGAFRIERAQNRKYSRIYHTITDFSLKCIDLIEKIEVKNTHILAFIKGGGDPIILQKIPEEAIALIEWMITTNHQLEKRQHLDSEPLESQQQVTYTYHGNGKQTSPY